MIRHIVLYRLREENKEKSIACMKEKLEALVGQVEGLRTLTVRPDCNTHSYDVCLVAEFDSPDALHYYKKHPAHVAASDYVHSVMTDRAAFDYEL